MNEKIQNYTSEDCEKRIAEIKAEMNADGANIEELSAEFDAIEARMKALAEAEEQRKALASKIAGDVTLPIVEERKETMEEKKIEVRNTPEYIEAFANYIKTNKDTECRALLTENVSGDVPVPEVVYDIVKTAWEREEIMSRVRRIEVAGNFKVAFELSADDAQIHTEGGDPITEEDLKLGIVTMVPVSIKKYVSVSDEVLDMTGENFLRYIYDELTHRIAKKAADTLVAKIVAAPTTSTATAPGQPAISVAAIAMDTIATAVGNLSDEATNPVVIMNKLTWSAFKAVQYANGFSADPFEGLTVIFNNSLKSFAAATTGEVFAIVGDLNQGALANFPAGNSIKFKYDDLTKKDEDLVDILGRQYVAVDVVAVDSFTRIKKS